MPGVSEGSHMGHRWVAYHPCLWMRLLEVWEMLQMFHFSAYALNQSPKGIIWTAVPLPCIYVPCIFMMLSYFDVLYCFDMQGTGQRPWCIMGRNSVHPPAPLKTNPRALSAYTRPLRAYTRPLRAYSKPLKTSEQGRAQDFRAPHSLTGGPP